MEKMGNGKYSLGKEQTEGMLPMKRESMETKTLPMPTERTCDKPVNQDGNVGKRAKFLKTAK